MTIFPRARMPFFEALAWAERGYRIRRAIWRLTEAFPLQIAGVNDLPLVWIYGEPQGSAPGIYYFVSDTTGIVTNVKLTAADMRAEDWTCDTVDPGNQSADPALTGPNEGRPGIEDGASSGSSGSSSDSGGSSGSSGSSGGSSGGTGSGGTGFSGSGTGGGSGGSGGGGGGGRRGGGPRANPSIVLYAYNATLGPAYVDDIVVSNPPSWSNTALLNSFAGSFSIADPAAKPGEIWFATVTHSSPTGFQTVFHGTAAPNAFHDFTFDITAPPAAKNYLGWTQEKYRVHSYDPDTLVDIPGSGPFGVQVSAFLPFTGLEASGSGTVEMRPHKQWCNPDSRWVMDSNACIML